MVAGNGSKERASQEPSLADDVGVRDLVAVHDEHVA
jgi:hypothetical protein